MHNVRCINKFVNHTSFNRRSLNVYLHNHALYFSKYKRKSVTDTCRACFRFLQNCNLMHYLKKIRNIYFKYMPDIINNKAHYTFNYLFSLSRNLVVFLHFKSKYRVFFVHCFLKCKFLISHFT